MTESPRRRLFLLSAIALFVELALIRWLGCEVRIFAYFKNLILIACFLGFGVGFHRARRDGRLGTSLAVLLFVIAVVAVPQHAGWDYGPQIATRALSNFYGSILMGDLPSAPAVAWGTYFLGLFWTAALFTASFLALFGYAQRLGADIDAFGPRGRLEAYSWNVGGSLAGILAFSLMARLALPPLVWFLAVLAGTVPFLDGWRRWVAAPAGIAFLLLALPPGDPAIWSPYHKLEVSRQGDGTRLITVNGTGYMILRSFAADGPPGERAGFDRWSLPHLIREHAARVLILGAGGGNDATAALRAGAERIVAVEIDPEIHRLGKDLHPDAPYDDPRVSVIIDDARHFAETTPERFDLIVYSHLDAHTALSGFTNIRLDNYVHTVESFSNCRRLLAPGGALYVSFWATQDWVAARLEENLRLAFGKPPLTYYLRDGNGVIQAHYVATDDPGVAARGLAVLGSGDWHPEGPPPPPSTDDWPYLFVRRPIVPTPMILLAVPLLILCAAIVGFLVRQEQVQGKGWPLDRHFFFLGAAFLLVEVHNVSRLARVFGTTWAVNAWVISGVLLSILLANLVASRWKPPAAAPITYGLLVASLSVGALIPTGALTALPLGSAWVVLLYSLPLLFAGAIFGWSFREAADAPRALGSNVLGSILGGFLELTSFTIGVSGLLFIAVALYAASYPVGRVTPARRTAGGLAIRRDLR
jgi:SAM-dependent methyltransferase